MARKAITLREKAASIISGRPPKGARSKSRIHFQTAAVNLLTGSDKYRKMVGFNVYDNYPWWQNLYYENDEYATACDIIARMISGGGWEWVPEGGTNKENQIRDWEKWKAAIDFETQMQQIETTKLAMGNALSVIADGLPELDQPDIILQHLHPYQVYPDWHETGAIKSWKIYADAYNVGAVLDVVHTTDMLHFTNSLFAKNKLGMALCHQLLIRMQRKRRIEAVCSLISENMSAPVKHIKVDLTEYDTEVPEGAPEETISAAQEKINEVTSLFTRRVKAADGYIYDVIVTDKEVEAIVLKAEVYLADVVQFLKHDQELVDSALMVPPVFKGKPGGSNRATSWNELLAYALYLRQHWQRDALQLQQKLIPKVLGIKEPAGYFEYKPLITEDQNAKLDAASRAVMADIMTPKQGAAYAGVRTDESNATSTDDDPHKMPHGENKT